MLGTKGEPALRWGLEHETLIVGWVQAYGVAVHESDAGLLESMRAAVAARAAEPLSDEERTAIRDLLRGRGYKPSGRGKPASEFLAAAAARDAVPQVNNVVDINNLLSLQTGWPLSVFDLDRALAGAGGLEVRYGEPGEEFVFNAAGQSIDIGGLVSIARVDGPAIGNPVKDSMATKIWPDTRAAVGVIYASRAVAGEADVQAVADLFADLLRAHAGASETATGTLS